MAAQPSLPTLKGLPPGASRPGMISRGGDARISSTRSNPNASGVLRNRTHMDELSNEEGGVLKFTSVDGNTYTFQRKVDGVLVPGFMNLCLLNAMLELSKGGDARTVFAAARMDLKDASGADVFNFQEYLKSTNGTPVGSDEDEIPQGVELS